MADLHAVPTLDEIAADPERVAELPAEATRTLTFRALAALSALHVGTPPPSATSAPQRTDVAELLGAREVAGLLGVSISWVEKHVDDLPPRRSLCGAPRWLRSDLERWIKARPRYGDVA